MKSNWRTRLIHSQVKVPGGFRSLVTPVFRGSTTLFSRAASIIDTWNHDDVPYTYGSHGTPPRHWSWQPGLQNWNTGTDASSRLAVCPHSYSSIWPAWGRETTCLCPTAYMGRVVPSQTTCCDDMVSKLSITQHSKAALSPPESEAARD
jgi:cystathionine beta-lyase/cystathionine gamma-synthase